MLIKLPDGTYLPILKYLGATILTINNIQLADTVPIQIDQELLSSIIDTMSLKYQERNLDHLLEYVYLQAVSSTNIDSMADGTIKELIKNLNEFFENRHDKHLEEILFSHEMKVKNLTRFYQRQINRMRIEEKPPQPDVGSNLTLQYSKPQAVYYTRESTDLVINSIDNRIIIHPVLNEEGYNPFVIKGVSAELIYRNNGKNWILASFYLTKGKQNFRHPHRFNDTGKWCLGEYSPKSAKTIDDVKRTFQEIMAVLSHVDTHSFADPMIYRRWMNKIFEKTSLGSIEDFTKIGGFNIE